MYVVTLKERFDNNIPNLPIFVCRRRSDAEKFIAKEVKKDLQNKRAISEWFNGEWSEP